MIDLTDMRDICILKDMANEIFDGFIEKARNENLDMSAILSHNEYHDEYVKRLKASHEEEVEKLKEVVRIKVKKKDEIYQMYQSTKSELEEAKNEILSLKKERNDLSRELTEAMRGACEHC